MNLFTHIYNSPVVVLSYFLGKIEKETEFALKCMRRKGNETNMKPGFYEPFTNRLILIWLYATRKRILQNNQCFLVAKLIWVCVCLKSCNVHGMTFFIFLEVLPLSFKFSSLTLSFHPFSEPCFFLSHFLFLILSFFF